MIKRLHFLFIYPVWMWRNFPGTQDVHYNKTRGNPSQNGYRHDYQPEPNIGGGRRAVRLKRRCCSLNNSYRPRGFKARGVNDDILYKRAIIIKNKKRNPNGISFEKNWLFEKCHIDQPPDLHRVNFGAFRTIAPQKSKIIQTNSFSITNEKSKSTCLMTRILTSHTVTTKHFCI